MAIKFSSILILIGMISTLLVLSSCTTPLECPPCDTPECETCEVCTTCEVCETCPDLTNPTEDIYYDMGCVQTESANNLVDLINTLSDFYNLHNTENKTLDVLPYYTIKEEVGE